MLQCAARALLRAARLSTLQHPRLQPSSTQHPLRPPAVCTLRSETRLRLAAEPEARRTCAGMPGQP